MIVLSVHLITFNNEKHIEETLQSILKQKVDFEYEIVVGDDCSIDDTLTIINKYQLQYPNIFKAHKNERQLGILGNFKATLDRCVGDFVFDIAGDDLLKHDYSLQKMVDVLKMDDTLGFVDSGIDYFYDKTKTTKPFCNKTIIQAAKKNYKEQLLLGKIIPVGVCYNRKYLNKYVDFDAYSNMKITIEDYPILVDLVMNTRFETINESLHLYRVHDDSYSHSKSFDQHLFLKKQMKDLFFYFNNKYKFDDVIIETFHVNYNKSLLLLAGDYEEKVLGNATFKKIKFKSVKDYMYYLASQNTVFRRVLWFVKR